MNHTDKVKHSVEKNADLATDLLDEATERLSDLADNAKAAGEKLLVKAKDQANDLLDDAQDTGKGAWKKTAALIRKNPGAAVSCAFVAGAVLYAIFGRRED